MDHPARLPIDCPRCENRGHIDFGDDDVRLPCPLCNNWCTLCLEGVPTFVPIPDPTAAVSSPACGRPLMARGCLRSMPVAITRRRLRVTPILRRRWSAAFRQVRRTSQHRGASSSYTTAMERQETGRSLKMRLGRPLVPIDTRPMGRSSIPVQWSSLSKHDADLA